MRDTAGSAAAPAARCSKFRRRSFILVNPSSAFSLDHLIGAADKRERHRDAERFCGLHVDDQLEFRGLLDRQLRRLLTFENSTSINAERTVCVRNGGSAGAGLAKCAEPPIGASPPRGDQPPEG